MTGEEYRSLNIGLNNMPKLLIWNGKAQEAIPKPVPPGLEIGAQAPGSTLDLQRRRWRFRFPN